MQGKWITLSQSEGVRLIREYGLPDFPDIEYQYMHWHNCGVVAFLDKGNYSEVHIAMHPECRSQCRLFVSDIIKMIDNNIVALVEGRYNSIGNLLRRFGFKMSGPFNGVRLNKTHTEVYKYEFCR